MEYGQLEVKQSKQNTREHMCDLNVNAIYDHMK
jgi:hypothetical protein